MLDTLIGLFKKKPEEAPPTPQKEYYMETKHADNRNAPATTSSAQEINEIATRANGVQERELAIKTGDAIVLRYDNGTFVTLSFGKKPDTDETVLVAHTLQREDDTGNSWKFTQSVVPAFKRNNIGRNPGSSNACTDTEFINKANKGENRALQGVRIPSLALRTSRIEGTNHIKISFNPSRELPDILEPNAAIAILTQLTTTYEHGNSQGNGYWNRYPETTQI